MCIADLDRLQNNYLNKVQANQPLTRAFPELHSTEGHGAGYTWPMHALRDALIWLWLEWHRTKSIESVRRTIKPIIDRAIEANADTLAYQTLREDHDNFLIQLAILTGVKDWMYRVAESVIEADIRSKEYQYLQAWTGILKYRILGNYEKVIEQQEIMTKWKPTRIFLWPLDKLVGSFVDRDYKTFNSVLKKSCERQWKWAKKESVLSESSDGTLVLNIAAKHPHFMWPWVECAFAKLAYIDGATITYDSFWLPLALVKAIDK